MPKFSCKIQLPELLLFSTYFFNFVCIPEQASVCIIKRLIMEILLPEKGKFSRILPFVSNFRI